MKHTLLILLLLFTLSATAQRSPYFERIRSFTRVQTLELRLNEPDIIKLSKVNQNTLPLLFEAKTEAEIVAVFTLYKARLSYLFTPEQVTLLTTHKPKDEQD